MNRWETQLRKGLVELAVLAAIGRGETYGYRIVEQLQKLEGLALTESTVYPVLTRLARDGFLAIRAEVSPSGPTRRYYRLTAEGQGAAAVGKELEDGFSISEYLDGRSTDMMVETVQLSESLQSLVDSRLDTIDRMLLGRLSRQDRLAIVREAESQIHELLHESNVDELSRDDVLAVLARLDPPEAYIPDELEGERVSVSQTVSTTTGRPAVRNDAKVGKASGVLGLTALALMLLLPVNYVIAVALNSEIVALVLYFGDLLLTVSASVLALALGIYPPKSLPWAMVGIVTSLLSLVLSFATVIVAILLG